MAESLKRPPSRRSGDSSSGSRRQGDVAGRRRRGDVRGQILKAATRMFATHGFTGTSLQSVAEQVGISKPAILHYFPSKEDLRSGVVADVLQHWKELIPDMLRSFSSGVSGFETVAQGFVRFVPEDSDRARLLVRAVLDRPREFRALFLEHVRPWLEVLGNGIREGQESGVYRMDVKPEAYVGCILSLIVVTSAGHGILASPSAGDAREAREDILHELLRIARSSLFVDAPLAEPPTPIPPESPT